MLLCTDIMKPVMEESNLDAQDSAVLTWNACAVVTSESSECRPMKVQSPQHCTDPPHACANHSRSAGCGQANQVLPTHDFLLQRIIVTHHSSTLES